MKKESKTGFLVLEKFRDIEADVALHDTMGESPVKGRGKSEPVEESDIIASNTNGLTESSLSPTELGFIQQIIKNTRFSIKPRSVPLRDKIKEPNLDSYLSIATISTSLAFLPKDAPQGAEFHFKPIRRDGDKYSLFTLDNNYSIEQMKEFFTNAILKAGDALDLFEGESMTQTERQNAQRIIVVNEFGFPFPMEREEIEQYLHDLEYKMYNESKLIDFWERTYLVFGTYHCHRNIKNSAVISLPYLPKEEKVEPIDNKQSTYKEVLANKIINSKGNRFNFTHDKFAPAEKIEEILTPKDKIEWLYYETNIGKVGVLVCFDAIDSRMLLRLARLQFSDKDSEAQHFSLIIVPTFSPNEEVAECCELLSGILDTTVVYVNAQYPSDDNEMVGAEKFTMRNKHNASKSGHGYFYKGQRVSDDKFTPIGWKLQSENLIDGVEGGRNLWYSISCLIADRGAEKRDVTNLTRPSSAFDLIFSKIFESRRK
jgi:hypothetical protein